jgi:hypothetical protein
MLWYIFGTLAVALMLWLELIPWYFPFVFLPAGLIVRLVGEWRAGTLRGPAGRDEDARRARSGG